MVEAPANTGALENPVLCKHKDAITSVCQEAWDDLSPEMIKEVNDQTVHFLPEDNQRVRKSSDQEQHMLAVPGMCHSSKSRVACMARNKQKSLLASLPTLIWISPSDPWFCHRIICGKWMSSVEL